MFPLAGVPGGTGPPNVQLGLPNIPETTTFEAVCEIFSVKEWYDIESRVRVRSMSLEMTPFNRSHRRSYSPSIVTMALSYIICEI